MTHAPSEDRTHHHPHVMPLRIYAGVLVALLVLTVVTVKVSYYNFGVLNLIVAMGVASLKASLVVLFFMHLKYDEKFNAVVFAGSLTFLAVFLVLTLSDTIERGKVDPLEAKTLFPVPARPELSHGQPNPGAPGEHGLMLPPGVDTTMIGPGGGVSAPPESVGTPGGLAPSDTAHSHK